MRQISRLALGLLGISMGTAVAISSSQPAWALELNWSGQFWSEFHFINNYTLDSNNITPNPALITGGVPNGYYIPGGGSSTTGFETLFARVRPKLIINDNIAFKTEWWLGEPAYSLFGSAYPYPPDQRLYNATYSRGAIISAQRFWADLTTDFGTVQIGRAPLEWGLGVIWNSGEDLFSRYESTADVIRLNAKFGNFSFIPSVNIYSIGNNIGGALPCTSTGVCTVVGGSGRLQDFSIALRYENLDEEVDGGVNLIKRLGDSGLDVSVPASVPYAGVVPGGSVSSSINYNTWDIYGRKRWRTLSLGFEIPVISGSVGGLDYTSYALAFEGGWKPNDALETKIRAGYAPGQPDSVTGPTNLASYKAVYFHPNYQIGLIMFNYQFANFAGPNTLNNSANTASTLRSPWDNPIVNARYLSVNQLLKTQKWTFNTALIYAQAPETALTGQPFFNYWYRRIDASGVATKNQGSNLGLEWDAGAGFQWDDNFLFRLDLGLFFPGDFYRFNNTATDNVVSTVFATVARIGITF